MPAFTPGMSHSHGAAAMEDVLLGNLSSISHCLECVLSLHAHRHNNISLKNAVESVKRTQCQRFRRTYQDILVHTDMRYAADFFLSELYGETDFSQRDVQFSRITTSLQRFFPARVQALTLKLLQLHALSEQLDHAMAQYLLKTNSIAPGEIIIFSEYFNLWIAVGHPFSRKRQLAMVGQIGAELTLLTQIPGLRRMLKLMRGPAQLSGLSELQDFLESGFDIFYRLQRSSTGVSTFLHTIEARESSWINHLFNLNPTQLSEQLLWPELESFIK